MIKNATGRILGTDGHSLGGSSSIAEDSAQSSVGNQGTTNDATYDVRYTPGSNGTTRATFTDIVTPADSLMILVISMATRRANIDEQTKTWLWKEDGSTIETVNLSPCISGGDQRARVSVLVVTPASGTHTYTLVEGSTNTYGAVEGVITFVKLTDTHVLSGSNNQKTVSSGIIK